MWSPLVHIIHITLHIVIPPHVLFHIFTNSHLLSYLENSKHFQDCKIIIYYYENTKFLGNNEISIYNTDNWIINATINDENSWAVNRKDVYQQDNVIPRVQILNFLILKINFLNFATNFSNK